MNKTKRIEQLEGWVERLKCDNNSLEIKYDELAGKFKFILKELEELKSEIKFLDKIAVKIPYKYISTSWPTPSHILERHRKELHKEGYRFSSSSNYSELWVKDTEKNEQKTKD